MFIMAAIGSAVGLGNIWRFPYVAYANGGGAFIIPYLVALFTAGIPLMILEFGLGSMMRGSAPVSLARIKKGYEWIGWLAILVGFLVIVYYAVIMGWALVYFVYSLDLSWGKDPANFFNQSFLNLSSGPHELGGIRWPILGAAVLCWLTIYFSIFRGVKTVGKIVMWTVPVPIILLLVFVVRGLTLPGAMEGLRYYLTPDLTALYNPQVWLAAYGQIFFSLSIGFGVMITYASYLPKGSDIVNNAFITSLGNCGFSFLSGLAVFSVLGYLAQASNVAVEKVVASGPSLAFVTYPAAINLLPFGARVFGALFFLLLLTLAIDSAFSLVEATVASVRDKWKITRGKANLVVCFVALVFGIIYTTRGGLFWLDIVDHFLNNFVLVLVGLAECLVIGYVFGARRMRSFVNEVSDFTIGVWWDICIKFITPAILGISLVWVLIQRITGGYEGYPGWAVLLGGGGIVVLAVTLALLFSASRGKESD